MKKLIGVLGIALLAALLSGGAAVSAAEQNYGVISWCADSMEVGNTTGINGLEFIQPTSSSSKPVRVTNGGRNNEVGSYSNTINTGGSASMLDTYVPKSRALKFTVTQPCDINIYAYSASSDANIDMKLSRDGKLIDTFQLIHSDLKLYKAYLDSAGTYYIYSSQGSAAVCEIKVGYVRGDLDCDFDSDWNDLRLARRAFYKNDYRDSSVEGKLDLDNDGIVTCNDITVMWSLEYFRDTNKAVFISSKCWDANNMTLGNPETYEGLELVYKDNDISNKSISVIAYNKVYSPSSVNERKYTKCISTDGEMSKASGNYPVTKAVKFNLKSDAYVTFYISTGSSREVQHKAEIIDADGNNIGEFDITKSIERYTIRLDGDQTYFLGSSTGTIRIYEIEVNAGGLDSVKKVSKSINVSAGQNYIYTLTINNAAVMESALFDFEYNSSVLELVSVNGVKIADLKGKNESGLTDVVLSHGEMLFKTDNIANGESGILTEVELKAEATSTATISLSVEGE